MMTKPTLLLEAHLKALRLPTFLREYSTKSRGTVPKKGSTVPATCSTSASWSSSIASSAPSERRIKAAKLQVLKSRRHLRVPCDPVGEQTPGAGAGPLGVSRPQRERLGVGQLRHGQDPSGAGVGARGLPEGLSGALHHRRRDS